MSELSALNDMHARLEPMCKPGRPNVRELRRHLRHVTKEILRIELQQKRSEKHDRQDKDGRAS